MKRSMDLGGMLFRIAIFVPLNTQKGTGTQDCQAFR